MDCDDEHFIGKIETDVRRTFPNHPFFFETNGSGVQALRNVLQAYCVKNPRIGYCQGMNFLVGVLLLNMKEEVRSEPNFILFLTHYNLKL